MRYTAALLLFLASSASAGKKPDPPVVEVWSSNAYQVCAELRHRDFPVPHAHLRAFIRPLVPLVEGDVVLVTLTGGRELRFHGVDSIYIVDWPGGLGTHSLDAVILRDGREFGRHASLRLSVYLCDVPSL